MKIHLFLMVIAISFTGVCIHASSDLDAQGTDTQETDAQELLPEIPAPVIEVIPAPEIHPVRLRPQSAVLDIDLPIDEYALINRYRTQYTSPEGLKYLSAVMKRSAPYRDFIIRELDRIGAPARLLYLPVIESGFSVSAISRSGATGLWQFMKNSIAPFNIRVNEWLDERRDPWLTTTAAIRKLKENYEYLGDWNLALAAYNCGLGATKTAMKKGGSSDYWYLCNKGFFKTETIHYVPKFLAIAEILDESDIWGIDWGASEEAHYDIIPIKRAVDITLLAREVGVDVSEYKKANPSLIYNITPPDTNYGLRVPAAHRENIENLLTDKNRKLLEYYMYHIKSGDTLYALALHYGITVDMLMQHNPGIKPSTLKIGSKIIIPALKQVGVFAGKKDPESLNFSGTYMVKQGDSLWSIALAHNIQVETLAERNNIEVNSVLRLGKALRVPIL